MSEHKEPIPSMIYNASVGGHVTNSQQIIDEIENKEQSQINVEVKQIIGQGGSIDERINQAKSEIKGDATSACDTLGKAEAKINANTTAVSNEAIARANAVSVEAARAQAAEENLRTLYNNIQQSQPIPVTALPTTGETGKIYRLAGTTSYSDYMYSEGALTTPIKMAEYDNAIDDTINFVSENLAKTKAIRNSIEENINRALTRTCTVNPIPFTGIGGYINNTSNAGININNLVISENSNYAYVAIPCNPGQVFTVVYNEGNNLNLARLYSFYSAPDSEGHCSFLNILPTVNDNKIEYTNFIVSAPENAGFVIFNLSISNTNKPPMIIEGFNTSVSERNFMKNRQLVVVHSLSVENVSDYVGSSDYKSEISYVSGCFLTKGDTLRTTCNEVGESISYFQIRIKYEDDTSSQFGIRENSKDIIIPNNKFIKYISIQLFKIGILSNGPVNVKVEYIGKKLLEDEKEKELKKSLKILIIGSSGEQSYIPYIPPILNEVLDDYDITIGDMYSSGADASTYVNMYKNSTPCTDFSLWKPGDTSWTIYHDTVKLEDALELEDWDMIGFKGTDSSSRNLMRIIQSLIDYPVSFFTFARYARRYDDKQAEDNNEICLNILDTISARVKAMGYFDYIPVGTAIQNTRSNDILKYAGVTWGETKQFTVPANSYLTLKQTVRGASTNPTLKARRISGSGEVVISLDADNYTVFTLTDNTEQTAVFSTANTGSIKFTNNGNDACVVEFTNIDSVGDYLLEDDQHLQDGIGVLVAAYTLALKFMEWSGNSYRGINGSSWVPTIEACTAIGIGEGIGLAHGYPCGIVDYIGSDGNHYDMSQLTTINDTLYVAETVFNDTPDANSVTATAGNVIYKNIYAAQEIAEIAVGNPTEITDCSNIVIDIPQKNQL